MFQFKKNKKENKKSKNHKKYCLEKEKLVIFVLNENKTE